jgi:hypothetical protein
MDQNKNGHPQAVANSAPASYRRMLMLGYYDGPTDGVIEADSGQVYRFELKGQIEDLWDASLRPYLLRPMPLDAMDRLVKLIDPYFPPRWPVWAPIWNFTNESLQADIDAQVENILQEAGPPCWLVELDSRLTSTNFAQVRPWTSPTVRT